MRNQTTGRRRFLQSLGVCAATVPGLASRALAAPETLQRPLRFVGVFMPHGVVAEYFRPGAGFDLRGGQCLLAPFDDPERFGRSFRDIVLPIDGIDLTAGIEVGTVGHDASRVILTGSGARGTNASLDQYLAVECALGAETPLTSLVLGVGSDDTGLGFNLSYSQGGVPVPKLIDPSAVFDELFGKVLTDEETIALEQRRRVGKSVLDAVRTETTALWQLAPASERHKLEQHQTALREVEKRLLPAARQCGIQARPDRSTFPALHASAGGEPYFEVITSLQFDLVARAFACDLTRFVTIYLGDLTRSPLNLGLPSDIHLDVAHRYEARRDGRAGNPASWDALAIQNRHTYAQVAGLMQRLDSAAVLSDTVILAQGDMGDTATHSSRNVPTLVAGGCGGHFRLGRFLDLKTKKQAGEMLPNNRLLVSIAQAFGAPVTRFGSSSNPDTLIGRLEELRGA
jgi:Protein of unknown function (DUF1552)